MPCVSDSEENEQKDKIEQGASDEFCNGTNPRRSFASSSRFGRPGGRAKVPFHEFNKPRRGSRSATAHSTTRTRLATWEVFAAQVGWQREWQLRGGLQHRECERFWEHGGHWSWCRVSCEISWSGCSRRNEVIQGEKSNGSRSCGNVALCQGSWLLKFWLLKVWNSMTEMTKTEMKASSEKSSIENTELWEKIVWESGFVLSQTKWSGEKFGLAGVGDKIRMRGSQV